MITPEQMIQREVLCCMSSLVSTLANGHCLLADQSDPRHRKFESGQETLALITQASELAAPVLDYEEAATQNGFYFHPEYKTWVKSNEDSWDRADREEYGSPAECVDDSRTMAEPYEWEVYEHWAVSTWLAEKLQAQGERVDTDFAGLCIWARTTTGQAISMDGCIQCVYAEMTAPHDSVATGA